MSQRATVKYHVATYEGEVSVTCGEDDDNEVVIAKAKAVLKRQVGFLPFGYQSWEIINRE